MAPRTAVKNWRLWAAGSLDVNVNTAGSSRHLVNKSSTAGSSRHLRKTGSLDVNISTARSS
eukprot:5281646-Prorocentrum_lima.AAC.1